MNSLSGSIIKIEHDQHLSLVDVLVGGDTFTALLLETPLMVPYLQVGNTASVLFRETEVALAKNLSGQLSLRNRIRGTVQSIRYGEILSIVVLDHQSGAITSILTTRAVQRLELRVGDEVEALIKANEVSLVEKRDES